MSARVQLDFQKMIDVNTPFIYIVVPQKAENSLILINKRSLFLSMFTVFIIFA